MVTKYSSFSMLAALVGNARLRVFVPAEASHASMWQGIANITFFGE